MYQVIGLGFDGCQASGLTSPFDVFNVVNTIWKQQGRRDDELYSCKVASLDGAGVTCSNGMRVAADLALQDVVDADLIIVPGIHHYDSKTLLSRLNTLHKECRWLKQKIDDGVLVTANCSGVFLLADTGVLTGKEATTAWWLKELFIARFPDVKHRSDQLLIKNKGSFTTGSMTANLGVMLQIAEQQVGRQLAQTAARTMLIDASQTYAAPYLFLQEQSDHKDSLVLAVESQLQRDIAKRIDMDSLANSHSVSVRTLSRRFKSANGINLSDYLQNLRLEQTKLLLETTSLSIEQIVERVGYSSQSSLRRLFQKQLGISPREYRAKTQQA